MQLLQVFGVGLCLWHLAVRCPRCFHRSSGWGYDWHISNNFMTLLKGNGFPSILHQQCLNFYIIEFKLWNIYCMRLRIASSAFLILGSNQPAGTFICRAGFFVKDPDIFRCSTFILICIIEWLHISTHVDTYLLAPKVWWHGLWCCDLVSRNHYWFGGSHPKEHGRAGWIPFLKNTSRSSHVIMTSVLPFTFWAASTLDVLAFMLRVKCILDVSHWGWHSARTNPGPLLGERDRQLLKLCEL